MLERRGPCLAGMSNGDNGDEPRYTGGEGMTKQKAYGEFTGAGPTDYLLGSVVSIVALAAAAAHFLLPGFEVDAAGLSLILLVMFPWLVIFMPRKPTRHHQ